VAETGLVWAQCPLAAVGETAALVAWYSRHARLSPVGVVDGKAVVSTVYLVVVEKPAQAVMHSAVLA
jgi:hypothetical protein